MNDLHNNVRTKNIVTSTAIGANATKTGLVEDRQGWGSVELIATYGSVTTTGSVVTLVVKEGDTTGAMTSVADSDLLGTEALASLAAATPRTAGTTKEVTKRIGYRGNKRYISADTVSTGVTSVGTVGVVAVFGDPTLAPTDNP